MVPELLAHIEKVIEKTITRQEHPCRLLARCVT
jgi:hypothetical protein